MQSRVTTGHRALIPVWFCLLFESGFLRVALAILELDL